MDAAEIYLAYAMMVAALGFAIFWLVQRFWLRVVLIVALVLMMPIISAFLIFLPGPKGGALETFFFAVAFMNVGGLALVPVILLFRRRRA